MAEDEAKRVNVNVDNYTISRITGTKELWFRDMPDVSFVVAISFTDDPNKCCIKYPKDLVQITKMAMYSTQRLLKTERYLTPGSIG